MAVFPHHPAYEARRILDGTTLMSAAGHLAAALFVLATVAMSASIIATGPKANTSCALDICD